MTEGNQDNATQQLSENNKADEKPVQDNSEQRTEDSSVQLASGNNLFITRPRVLDIEYVFDGLVNRTERILKARYLICLVAPSWTSLLAYISS